MQLFFFFFCFSTLSESPHYVSSFATCPHSFSEPGCADRKKNPMRKEQQKTKELQVLVGTYLVKLLTAPWLAFGSCCALLPNGLEVLSARIFSPAVGSLNQEPTAGLACVTDNLVHGACEHKCSDIFSASIDQWGSSLLARAPRTLSRPCMTRLG